MKGIAIINSNFKSLIESVFSLKLFSFISKLIIATVDTFANSDGCKVNNPKLYQLRAPLTIGAIEVGTRNIPINKVKPSK